MAAAKALQAQHCPEDASSEEEVAEEKEEKEEKHDGAEADGELPMSQKSRTA